MDVPAKHPWLWRRGNTFYLRAKVPADIIACYPRKEEKRSLKTQDRVEASRLIHQEAAIVEHLFADYRRYRGPPPKPSKIVRHGRKRFVPRYDGSGKPPDDLVSSEQLKSESLDRLLATSWSKWQSWIDAPVLQASLAQRKAQANQLEMDASIVALADDDLSDALFQQAAEVLESAGYYFDRSGAVATKLGEMLLEAEYEAYQLRVARLRGAPATTPRGAHNALKALGGVDSKNSVRAKTLSEVILMYESDVSRSGIVEKTRAEDRRTFALLTELLGGDTPISEIKRPQCTAFRDLICSLPKNAQQVCRGMPANEAVAHGEKHDLPKLSPKGANKYLHKLSALMKYAIDEELYFGSNPAKKIALAHEHSVDDRMPFSSEQLKAIFSSDAYRASALRSRQSGLAVEFWVPLLALFMGLRLGEACQLLATDFSEERGVPFVKIQATEGRRLKSKKASRVVPCHPYLLSLGLLRFVDRCPGGRLFPDAKRGSDKYFSPFSKSYSRFLSTIGAKTPKTSFHSFRHNFRDALTAAGAPDNLSFALGGWKEGWTSTGNKYGSRPQVSSLLSQLEKVSYDAVPTSLLQSLVQRTQRFVPGVMLGTKRNSHTLAHDC